MPDEPTEPAVDVRLTVPVAALTVMPPPKLLVLFRLPAELRLIELVLAFPTGPDNANEPFVEVSSMVLPLMLTPALELRLPELVKLKSFPAIEFAFIVVVPAFVLLINTLAPPVLADAEIFVPCVFIGLARLLPMLPVVAVNARVVPWTLLVPVILAAEFRVTELVDATLPTPELSWMSPVVVVITMSAPPTAPPPETLIVLLFVS